MQLVGKLGHLAKGAPWIFHLLTHLYASIAYALAKNKQLLLELSREFREIVHSLRTGSFPCSSNDQVCHNSFALKKVAKLVHHAKFKFIINKLMQQEIKFFWDKLQPDSGILWETPIAHIIPQSPTATPLETADLKELEVTLSNWVSGGTSISSRK